VDLKRAVERQFGAAAASYAASFTHRGGPDLDALVAAAEPRDDERALDLGCGAGHCALALAPRLAEVQALDLTPAMLRQAEQLARERGIHNLQVRKGDAEALPYPDRHFDLVTSRLSAHHYPRPERALREAARVLRTGGRLLISDSVAPEQAALDTFLNSIELLRDPSHVRDHSLSQWSAMLAASGFAPELVGSWGLKLDFDEWVRRMRTPPDAVHQIRKLFAEAPAEVREHFQVEGADCRSWTIRVAVLRARLPES
jgi:SAM-dependent methyltransferase